MDGKEDEEDDEDEDEEDTDSDDLRYIIQIATSGKYTDSDLGTLDTDL